MKTQNFYSTQEIAQHDTINDYWMVMGNEVYAFVNFNHPGGFAIHAPFAGGKLDATTAFQVKHGSS